MLDQARKIAAIVSEKIPLGSYNIMPLNKIDSRDYLKSVTEFYRSLRDQIYLQLHKNGVSLSSEREVTLLDCFLCAVLAELYETANCGEFCKLGLVQFIFQGIIGVVELIYIEDQNSKMDHMFLLGNRSISSDIRNPTTWENVILIDLWSLVSDQVKQYPDHSISWSNILALNPRIKKISTIKVEIRIEKDLISGEWMKMNNIFAKVKPLIDEKMITPLLNQHSLGGQLDAKNETKRIQNKIQELVDCCKLKYEQAIVSSREEKLSIISTSLKVFDINSKINVEDKLQTTTGKKWIYYPPNKNRPLGEARFISLQQEDVVNMISFFNARGLTLAEKRLLNAHPIQFVAQFSNITLEKLKKLEEKSRDNLVNQEVTSPQN